MDRNGCAMYVITHRQEISQRRDLHSQEISQPRDLTAKRSHSQEISPRDPTANRSHSQEIPPRDPKANRSHSQEISQPRDLTAKKSQSQEISQRSHSQEISQPRDITAKRSHRTNASFSNLPLSLFARKLRFHIFHFHVLREGVVFTSSTLRFWGASRTKASFPHLPLSEIERKSRTKASFSHLQLQFLREVLREMRFWEIADARNAAFCSKKCVRKMPVQASFSQFVNLGCRVLSEISGSQKVCQRKGSSLKERPRRRGRFRCCCKCVEIIKTNQIIGHGCAETFCCDAGNQNARRESAHIYIVVINCVYLVLIIYMLLDSS